MSFDLNFRPKVYSILKCIKACTDIPDKLVPWLDVCEVENLVHYTRWPEDALPSTYSCVTGEPTDLFLELTSKGRAALLVRTKRSGSLTEEAVAALLGDESRQVLKVAQSDPSADNKMRAICAINRRFLGYKSHEWADLLGVTDAAIRKTSFWKVDRPQAIEAGR
jgi:hypothetical protein